MSECNTLQWIKLNLNLIFIPIIFSFFLTIKYFTNKNNLLNNCKIISSRNNNPNIIAPERHLLEKKINESFLLKNESNLTHDEILYDYFNKKIS